MHSRLDRLQLLLGLTCVVALVGCGQPGTSRADSAGKLGPESAASYLPVVSGIDLESRVLRSERPLLAEFGVDFGCYRCDQMRTQMTSLAREFEGQADVVRVDFNVNRRLAAQLGVTVCPSYVLFDQGQVVVRRSFPVTADLLATDLRSNLADGADEAK